MGTLQLTERNKQAQLDQAWKHENYYKSTRFESVLRACMAHADITLKSDPFGNGNMGIIVFIVHPSHGISKNYVIYIYVYTCRYIYTHIT